VHELAEAINNDKGFMGAHARARFADDARKLYDAANKKLDDAMVGTLAEIARVQAEIRPKPLADKSLAAEIRKAIKDVTPEERAKMLEADDDRTMAAVANGPAYLSKLDDQALEMYVTKWSNKRFPVESGRARRLRASLEDGRRIGIAGNLYFADLVKTTSTPSTAAAAKTEAAQAAVREAVSVAAE
jgi:hypothetical protein